jgi:hypothetical protein
MRQVEQIEAESDQTLLREAQGAVDLAAHHRPEPPEAQDDREPFTLPWIVILVSVTFALLALYAAVFGSR